MLDAFSDLFITEGMPDFNYTPDIIQATLEGVRKGFKQGLRYRKGGVMLLELTSAKERQHDLLMPLNEAKQEAVMKALDKVNHKYGEHTLFYAAAGMNEKLKMMRRYKSPHYTTQWDELPIAS